MNLITVLVIYLFTVLQLAIVSTIWRHARAVGYSHTDVIPLYIWGVGAIASMVVATIVGAI